MQTSIKEYIGARYVPKFYDDGHGGAEWNQNDTYEPLTVVQYEGNSFTSRQYVPAGISINNTAYWLETGNWNSQVEQYRQEVRTFDDRITDAQEDATAAGTAAAAAQTTANAAAAAAAAAQTTANSAETKATDAQTVNATQNTRLDALEAGSNITKLAIIGDSWADGWNGSSSITGWQQHMQAALGNPTMYEQHEGGAGFAQLGQSGNNFTQLLNILGGRISESNRRTVKYVVVAGGVNDRNAGYSTIVSAVKTFCDAARSFFPNATIYVAGISLMAMVSTTDAWNMLKTLRAYTDGAATGGAGYITNSEFIAVDCPWASDNAHLTSYQTVGRRMAAGVEAGSIDLAAQGTVSISGADADTEVTQGDTLNVIVHNNMTELAGDAMIFAFNGTNKPSLSYDHTEWFGRWDSTLKIKRGFGFQFTCFALANVVGVGWKAIPCQVTFAGDGSLGVRGFDQTGTGAMTVTALNLRMAWVYTQTLLV